MFFISRKTAECFAALAVCGALALSSQAFADEEEMSEEEAAAHAAAIQQADANYVRNIQPVHFPPVPFGWKLIIGDNTVSYVHAAGDKGSNKNTVVKMRYTRRTAGMDAEAYMRNYTSSHSCSGIDKQGTGFYTTSCNDINTYTVVIGEVDNMYIIEMTGVYSPAARAIIENYVGAIVSGKRVFADRNIGDLSDR